MMDLLFLSIRIIIGMIFLSSAISKILNMQKHIVVVRKYRVIPNKWVVKFSYLETFIELVVAICILLGFMITYAGILLMVLLLLYTVAITINLVNGITEISCGCGGIIGNHKLNWLLPIRNIILGIGILALIAKPKHLLTVNDPLLPFFESTVSLENIISTIIASLLFLIFLSNTNAILKIKSLFSSILEWKEDAK